MMKHFEMVSLGGLHCQVYTGEESELSELEKLLDKEKSLYAETERPFIVVVIPPGPELLEEIGREDKMFVRVNERVHWDHISLKPSLIRLFQIKWCDQEINVSDNRTYLRLVTYFRWKMGPKNQCVLSQLEDGIVEVDMTYGCTDLSSLNRCLGV